MAKPNPFKVLKIFQEVVKPGANAAHVNHETGWPATLSKAGSEDHYFALVSMSGINDALYVTPYPSLAAIAKNDKAEMNEKMRASLTQEQRDRMDKLAESAFMERDTEIYTLDPRQSYPTKETIAVDPAFWKMNPVVLAANAKKTAVTQAGTPKTEKQP
jgi:hypothetical protein